MDFDEFENQWNTKGNTLLDEGLLYISRLDVLPAPDGVFRDFADRLAALPFRPEQTKTIVTILGKKDPHLQEAGVILAGASASGLNNHDRFESALCAILTQKDLDPWVLEAINAHFVNTFYTASPETPEFFRNYAAVAYGGNAVVRTNAFHGIMRTRMIRPYDNAKSIIENRILQSVKQDYVVTATLPVVEREYNLSGYLEVRRFLREKHLPDMEWNDDR